MYMQVFTPVNMIMDMGTSILMCMPVLMWFTADCFPYTPHTVYQPKGDKCPRGIVTPCLLEQLQLVNDYSQ